MIRFMKKIAHISKNISQAWATGLWFFLIAYFAIHAFQGESSLSALKELEQQEFALKQQAQDIAAVRSALEMRTEKMGGQTVDPDLLEEQVRARLGFAHQDEVILFLE
ncbi:septum formation initiator family protein [Kordiimonas sp. SCSIO 12603]|uniref:FtsB family cell division protein n=1 Tax=Kordiimonas sp. SCSIO 12603 TaxID=2829596 RepID=UPI00351DA78A